MKKFDKIFFIVEGAKTEFDFVRNILAKEFPFDIKLQPIPIKKTKGGLIHYSNLKKDILRLVHSKNSLITTFIDYYGLPDDFPKYKEAKKIKDIYQKIEFLENAIKNDIQKTLDKELFNFIPYIQLHEFEALLFADVEKFNILFDNQIVEKLKQILLQFKNNPELIKTEKIQHQAKDYLLLSLITQKLYTGYL